MRVCSTLRQCCCVLSCCRRAGQETKAVNLDASMGYLLHLLDRLYWMIPLIGLGHLGKGHLAAGILALAISNLTILFIEGFLSSQDYLSQIATGSHRHNALRRWAYISFAFVLLIVAINSIACVIYTYVVYYHLGVRAHVSSRVILALWLYLPVIALHGLQIVLQTFLSNVGLSFPALMAGLGAVLVNAGLTTIMLGVMHMGILGSLLSLIASKACAVAILLFFVSKQLSLPMAVRELRQTMRKAMEKVRAAMRGGGERRRGARLHPSEAAEEALEVAMAPIHERSVEGVEMSIRRKRPPKISGFEIPASEDNHDNRNDSDEDDARDKKEGDEDLADDDDEEFQSIPLLFSEDPALSTTNDEEPIGLALKPKLFLDILRFAYAGFPAALLLCVHSWPLEISALVTASMGTVALSTQQLLIIVAQFVVWAFIHPLSTAAALRIRLLFQQRRLLDARYAVRVAYLQGTAVACLCGLLLYVLSSWVGFLFTSNPDITRRMASLAWLAALWVLACSLQSLGLSIMRVLGYQMDNLVMLLLALWVVGGSLGVYLAFYASLVFGLEGLWIGFLTGSGLAGGVLALQIACLDWEQELRKHLALTATTPVSLSSLVLSRVESRSLGGIHFRTYRDLDEELEELERLETFELVVHDTDP